MTEPINHETPPDAPATPEQLAALTFDAVKIDGTAPPDEEWLGHALYVRMALVSLTLSDERAYEKAVEGGPELIEAQKEFADAMTATKDFLEAVCSLLNTATLRQWAIIARYVENHPCDCGCDGADCPNETTDGVSRGA